MLALGSHPFRLSFYLLSALLLSSIFLWFIPIGVKATLVSSFWHFFLIGICAAIVANSTGAGGGIIFLPAFTVLGLSVDEALATSFAIQCFGMTSGALTWLALVRREFDTIDSWQPLPFIVFISAVPSVLGIGLTQWLLPHPPFNTHVFFSIFSVFVGASILYRTLKTQQINDEQFSPTLNRSQQLMIAICSFAGGVITAWLSIGVGEILAIVLLALGFNVRFSVAAAVCVSSISVLSAISYHLFYLETVHFSVLLFAGPGALIGGFIARYVAVAISPLKLKVVLSGWVLISGVIYFFVSI